MRHSDVHYLRYLSLCVYLLTAAPELYILPRLVSMENDSLIFSCQLDSWPLTSTGIGHWIIHFLINSSVVLSANETLQHLELQVEGVGVLQYERGNWTRAAELTMMNLNPHTNMSARCAVEVPYFGNETVFSEVHRFTVLPISSK